MIELLVVIAIIAILIALLLPAVQQAREAARRSQCKNNMKQLGLALHNYHDVHSTFPIGALTPQTGATSWRFALLPYLDQAPVYNIAAGALAGGTRVNFYPVGNSQHTLDAYNDFTRPLIGLVVPSYRCPSSAHDDLYEYTANFAGLGTQEVMYVGIMGGYPDPAGRQNVFYQPQHGGFATNTGGLLINEVSRFRDFTDGTSNSLIVGEQSGNTRNITRIANYHAGWAGVNATGSVATWVAGAEGVHRFGSGLTAVFHTPNPVSVGSEANSQWKFNTPLSSYHTGGVHVLMADGSTHFVSDNIDLSLLLRLSVRNDGQVVGEW